MGEDMTLPRLFYKLPELAQEWQKTEDDILQMAAADKLKLTIKYHGSVGAPTQGCNIEVSWEYLQLLPHDILKVLTTHGKTGYYRIDIAILNGEFVYTRNVSEPETIEGRKQDTPPLYISGYEDLFILMDEVARVEELYPELCKQPIDQEQISKLPGQPEKRNKTPQPPEGQGLELLHWDEIADYLKCSVSTAKRMKKLVKTKAIRGEGGVTVRAYEKDLDKLKDSYYKQKERKSKKR